SPLISFPFGQVETFLEVFAQPLIKASLLVTHQEGLCMYPPACEERVTIRAASVRLGPSEHHGIQAMSIFQHLFRAAEEGGIQQLDEHPELEVVSLMWRRGEEKEVSGVT